MDNVFNVFKLSIILYPLSIISVYLKSKKWINADFFTLFG
jgi:hypothetical protein